MATYMMDEIGNMKPLPELDDVQRLEIPVEPRLETQLRHLQDKVHAQGEAIDQLAEAVVSLAKQCHELAKTTGKLNEHHTAVAVTGALLRSVK
tara:strand:+ start:113 stop:391 length:279 start_codon:yes stop_codon:yes gene_type:complete